MFSCTGLIYKAIWWSVLTVDSILTTGSRVLYKDFQGRFADASVYVVY
ncbi:hypothetical protein RAAC3_TM7C00001G0435 [Candidatus Saccharibacteria bacterium RAAC3_TM7_1]|nr:hypothetical protein RAAC3_TM7C00001G0435 [Candidatus Saccharibacteria bacterium RAAC3_TM7_1]